MIKKANRDDVRSVCRLQCRRLLIYQTIDRKKSFLNAQTCMVKDIFQKKRKAGVKITKSKV